MRYLCEYWRQIWQSLVTHWSSAMAVMLLRREDLQSFIDSDLLGNLPANSKRSVQVMQHYNSLRMCPDGACSITAPKGSIQAALVHLPRIQSVEHNCRFHDPTISNAFFGESADGDAVLVDLADLVAYTLLNRGGIVQFGAYTLESSVALCSYVRGVKNIWGV